MKESRTVVVPVIGIPGSGKSTLCRMLQKCVHEHEDTYTIDMLCYDDLFDGYATEDGEVRKDDTYIADTSAITSETGKRVVEDTFAIQTGISLPPKRKDQGKHSTDEHTHKILFERMYATEASTNKHTHRRNTAGMGAKEAGTNMYTHESDRGTYATTVDTAYMHTNRSDRCTYITEDGSNTHIRESDRGAYLPEADTYTHTHESERVVDSEYLLRWRERRQKAVQWLRAMLTDSKGDSKDTRLRMILIDDNFYYRSMRKEIYQLADIMSIGYVQVWIVCDTEVAVRRDAHRTGQARVGAEVIQRMSARFDTPDPHEFAWEKHTICIDTTDWNEVSRPMPTGTVGEDSAMGANADGLDLNSGDAILAHKVKNIVAKITEHALKALEEPSQYAIVQKQAKERAAAQAQTQSNTLHQLDLKLKAIAGERIRRYRLEPKEKVSIKVYSKKVSDERRVVLSQARTKLLNSSSTRPSYDHARVLGKEGDLQQQVGTPPNTETESDEDFIARWCGYYSDLPDS